MTERLQRSARERMVFGVCGGLGEYFRTDPTIVRALFVLMAFAGGIGVLLYLVLAILMPPAGRAPTEPLEGAEGSAASPTPLDQAASRVREAVGGEPARRQELVAAVLIGLGILFLLSNLGLFRVVRWDAIWPLVLIAIGVLLLLQRARG